MTADLTSIAGAVAALVDARRTATALATSPGDLPPLGEDDALAVAEAVSAELGGTVGWKIGATSEVAQQMLGVGGPFAGRVHDLLEPGATFTPVAGGGANVESEFAFVLSAPLAARPAPYSRDEVTAAVGSLHPAIEVVSSRFTTHVGVAPAWIFADAGLNGALVLGPAVDGWADVDLGAAEAVMTVDGAETGRGTGALVLGHPLDALTWLVNHLSSRGIDVEAGDAVTTGTCTGLAPVAAGGTARADFGPLGAVEVAIG